MEKVYLLLRKNHQTGPYTYEELLQQQLQSTDLIWVEGKSTVWVGPTELDQLQAPVRQDQQVGPEIIKKETDGISGKNAPTGSSRYVKRKSPEAELEERAQALRDSVQAASQPTYHRPAPSGRHRHRHHMVYQEAESPLLLEMHTRHKKNVSLPQLIAAGVITALVAAGWYNREELHIVRPQKNEITQAASPVLFQVSIPAPPKSTVLATIDTVETEQPADTIKAIAPPVSSNNKVAKVEVKKETEKAAIAPALTSVAQTDPPKKKEETSTDTAHTAIVEQKDSAEATTTLSTNEEEIDSSTPVKKKGLGQAIKNIFKKKKRGEGQLAD